MYYSCLNCHLQKKLAICKGHLSPKLVVLGNVLDGHLITHLYYQDLHFLLLLSTQNKQYHTPLHL